MHDWRMLSQISKPRFNILVELFLKNMQSEYRSNSFFTKELISQHYSVPSIQYLNSYFLPN